MFHLAFHLILGISIHALREEGDGLPIDQPATDEISIHALREEGDQFRRARPVNLRGISIHALREEGDVAVCLPLLLF